MHKTKVTILGIVQTMGMRDQIKAVADGLGVCGTVENLRDGSVLVVCEAERADIEEMVRQIRSGAELAVIEDALVEEGPPATGMEGLEIIRGDSAEVLLCVWPSCARAMVTALNVMRQGQAQTNETPARMEQGQEELRRGQT
ncbi:MAG: acylphosphatase [Thaumarchaeota archaeon]|nr:acylphosphatase [Nitrososphaerota archaeon]